MSATLDIFGADDSGFDEYNTQERILRNYSGMFLVIQVRLFMVPR